MTGLDLATLAFLATSVLLLLMAEVDEIRPTWLRPLVAGGWLLLGAAFVWKAVGVIGPIVARTPG
jgi:hypothetical protein